MAAIDKVYVNSYEQADQFRTWCKAHTISDKYGVVKPLSYWVFKNINEWDDWSTAHPIFSAPNPVDYYVIRNCPFDFVQKSMKVNYDSAYDKIKNAEMYYTDNIGTINFETYQYLPDYTPGMHFSIKRVKGILHCDGVPVKSNRPYHTRQFTKNRISLDLKARDKWNKTHHNKDDQQSTQIHQPYWCIKIFKDKVTINSDFLRFMMYSVPKNERKIGTWDVIGDCVICYYKSSDCNDCRTIKALTRRIRKWKLPIGTELKVYQLRYPDDDYYKIVIKK